jgi:hypothetical protein
MQSVSFSMFVQFFYIGTPDCPASDHSGTGMKQNVNAGTRPVWNKETQSGTGMLQYRTKLLNAGMPMPATSASMPMPS